jgi:hypothetical protein
MKLLMYSPDEGPKGVLIFLSDDGWTVQQKEIALCEIQELTHDCLRAEI